MILTSLPLSIISYAAINAFTTRPRLSGLSPDARITNAAFDIIIPSIAMFLLFRLVDMTYLMRENPNARDIPETLVCLELQNSVIRRHELSGARLAPRHSSKVSVAALSIVTHEKETANRWTREHDPSVGSVTTLTAAAVKSEGSRARVKPDLLAEVRLVLFV